MRAQVANILVRMTHAKMLVRYCGEDSAAAKCAAPIAKDPVLHFLSWCVMSSHVCMQLVDT